MTEIASTHALTPKAGCRSWLPPALLLGSAVAVDVALTMGVLVVPGARERGAAGAGVMQGMTVAFSITAALLLLAGSFLALRGPNSETPRFVGWYTIVLLAMGILGAVPLLLFEWMIHRTMTTPNGPVHVFRFGQAIVASYSTALLVAALLRGVRSRVAAAWTTCVSLCLLACFPFGTAAGVVWLTSVRTKETSPS